MIVKMGQDVSAFYMDNPDHYYYIKKDNKINYYYLKDDSLVKLGRLIFYKVDLSKIKELDPKVVKAYDYKKKLEEYKIINSRIDQLTIDKNTLKDFDLELCIANLENLIEEKKKYKKYLIPFDYESVIEEHEEYVKRIFRPYRFELPKDFDIRKHEKNESIELLKQHKILSKKDWKDWLLLNHPDKNPNNLELAQKIIDAGRAVYN